MKSKYSIWDDEEGRKVPLEEIEGIDVNCFKCWKKMNQKGGILISPPSETSSDNVDIVQKMHLCKICFEITMELIMGKESPNYKTVSK